MHTKPMNSPSKRNKAVSGPVYKSAEGYAAGQKSRVDAFSATGISASQTNDK